jgi:hypothetical protein
VNLRVSIANFPSTSSASSTSRRTAATVLFQASWSLAADALRFLRRSILAFMSLISPWYLRHESAGEHDISGAPGAAR